MTKQLKKDILIYLLIFVPFTLLFWLTRLDIFFEQLFFTPENGWHLAEKPFWNYMYRYGIFAGYLLGVWGLFLLSYSYWKPKKADFRKLALLIIFSSILGPGILVNLTFKNNWGRPRPREIIEFGGTKKFEHAWVKCNSKGRSFPCGHASMMFILSIPFLYYRNRNKLLAWVFFIAGNSLGVLMGITRMLAGGHFASDVVWAAGMVWFSGLLVYYFLKTYKHANIQIETINTKQARRMTFIIGIILPLVTLLILLATPYISKKTIHRSLIELREKNISAIHTSFNDADINICFNENFSVQTQVTGFGFPNSKIRSRWLPGDTAQYFFEQSGVFTEVITSIEMELINSPLIDNILEVEEGQLTLQMPENIIDSKLSIHLIKGDVKIKVNSTIPYYINYNGKIKNDLNFPLKRHPIGDKILEIKVQTGQGRLILLQ